MVDAINTALAGVFQYVVAEIVLVAAACVIFLGGTVRASRNLWAGAALASLVAAGIALAVTATFDRPTGDEALIATFALPVVLDPLALLIKAVALGALLIERHELRHVLAGHWSPIGVVGEVRQDLLLTISVAHPFGNRQRLLIVLRRNIVVSSELLDGGHISEGSSDATLITEAAI